ncbi:MAG: molybdopterin-binding protein [Alphaproteobacteria bacterium]
MAEANRRAFLARGGAVLGLLALSGCDRISHSLWGRNLLQSAEGLTRRVQRAFAGSRALAREFSRADISPVFRANGTRNPVNPEYQALSANGFRDWRLEVNGLVERPLSLSLAALHAMPSRAQITRHDCVEGWSCIGEWKGVPLALVLAAADPKPAARYVVFYCADPMGRSPDAPRYYESLDMLEAVHPQTMLAYELNGEILPVAHGAPVRLRAERQLGYKMAKYVMRIELVESFARIEGGKGGYWEDRGYNWYAGI